MVCLLLQALTYLDVVRLEIVQINLFFLIHSYFILDDFFTFCRSIFISNLGEKVGRVLSVLPRGRPKKR